MAARFTSFVRSAQRLARNPLGIIALFIVLVYGIAGLVLGYSAQHLDKGERQPLVWFLVLFPVAVLAAFFRLVTHHHYKLYAPTDFPDSEGFFRSQTTEEQRQRLENETLAIEEDEEISESEKSANEEESMAVKARRAAVRQTYALAEELAFREIEAEFGVPVQRSIGIGADLLLDGIFSLNGVFTAVEIRFITGKHWERRVRETVDRVSKIQRAIPMPLILALVIDGLPAHAPEAIRSGFNKTQGLQAGHPSWLRIYDLAELMVKYGLTDDTS